MITGAVRCTIYPRSDQTDVYGQVEFGAPVLAKCDVVKLTTGKEKTSVRTDASASGGRAHETLVDATLLLSKRFAVKIGDRIDVSGISVEVINVRKQFGVTGQHEHNEIEANVWV